MRFAAWLGVALVTVGSACGQAGAQQDEIARLAPLYSIDLTHGDWQHEQAAICPAFQRHRFVFYHRAPMPGVRTSFMAVLPMKGKGHTMLVPITGEVDPRVKPVAEDPVTIGAFNNIFADELHHTGNGTTLPGLTWSGLAQCYAGLIGEKPVVDPVPLPDTPLDLLKGRVDSMLILVEAPGSKQRSVSLRLDPHGMVTGASVSETAPLR